MALGGRCAKKHGTVEPLQHNTIETSIAALRNGRLAIGCRAQDDKANARARTNNPVPALSAPPTTLRPFPREVTARTAI